MNIETGMYLRTKKGSIAKILGVDYRDDFGGLEIDNIEAIYFDTMIDDVDKDIYLGCMYLLKDCKASFNIIDLIEVNDYVNGYKVLNVSIKNNMVDIGAWEVLHANKFKEILTHEQYESMVYKL